MWGLTSSVKQCLGGEPPEIDRDNKEEIIALRSALLRLQMIEEAARISLKGWLCSKIHCTQMDFQGESRNKN